MRFLLITTLLFALTIQVVSAQDPGSEVADRSSAGWEIVLESGTLGRNAEIVPVEGGYAVSAESFEDPTRYFDSEWVLYDPVTGIWSDYEFPQAERSLLDLDEELLTLLDIADLVPYDPRVKYQPVDGGITLAFLLPDEYDFDGLSLYTTVLLVNPAKRTVKMEYVWYCQGPPNAELIVWDFPEQDLSVVCNAVFHHAGDEIRTEPTYHFIGSREPSPLYLFSHSPDHRYWILGRDRLEFDSSGPFYLFDRQTEQTTIMLWSLPHMPQREFIVWLNSVAVIASAGEFILHLDISNRTRHELLRQELAMLPGERDFIKPKLSTDGQWLLAATEDGTLFLRNVLDALIEVGYSEDDRSRE